MLASVTGRGAYVVQATIARCHAESESAASTDWSRIVLLYDELVLLSPSPIFWFNRAIAIGMRDGPDAGLALLDDIPAQLAGFRLVPVAQADLLRRAGRLPEAAARYRQAIPLAATDADRAQLQRRLAELSSDEQAASRR
jgi:RNA polymerase sigma-70 factor, ECF subfamily